MSAVGEAFIKGIGRPSARVPSDLAFTGAMNRYFWDDMQDEIGAGWFMDGFLYLFGQGLEELKPCVDAWSFAVPKKKNRVILGRNAYGAILFLDDEGSDERVGAIDPATVEYWSNPSCVFVNLIGNYLPRKDLTSHFFDDSLYRKWRAKNRGALELRDILALKTPISLGGEMALDSAQLEDIEEYYKTTAPIYAEAIGKKKPSPRGKRRAK